jgi:hypothetical protein
MVGRPASVSLHKHANGGSDMDHGMERVIFGHHGFGDDDGGNGRDFPGVHGRNTGEPATFDKIEFTTYLHSDNAADGSFAEQFILQVNGFELNGSPVTVPDFGSKFGMYFLVDATGQSANGAISFNTMNIALMVDRSNNDGAPSSTQSGGAAFANGTSGDYALATGTLSSASIVTDPDGTKHPTFVEQITVTEAGREVFDRSLDPSALLKELLTTPGGPTVIGVGNGDTVQIVNGTGAGGVPATGIAELSPQAPLTLRTGELNEGSHTGGHWAAASF